MLEMLKFLAHVTDYDEEIRHNLKENAMTFSFDYIFLVFPALRISVKT